jgi:hypothetical protein
MSRFACIGIILIAGCAQHQPARVAASPPASAESPTGLEIVRIVSRDQTVIVTAGPHGSLYSVNDADGRTLVANASLDELRDQHPDIYRLLEHGIADASVDAPSGLSTSGQPRSDRVLIMDSRRD